MRAPLSLRTQLLLLVGLPLLFLLVLEALASFLLAERMANLMFDLWLLDSVHSIAQEVRMRDDRIHFDADAEVLEVFGWDAVDDTYYQISTTAGEVIARNASLPPPDEHVLQAGASFADIAVGGRQVRMVSIAQRVGRELGVTVQVAETVDKRRWMMADIMVNVLVPKGVLIGFGMLLVGFALDRGLRPLSALTAEVDERSPRDLTPIALDRLPAELRGLSASTNKLLERLDRAIAAREQFIGNIAHQVRTPLAGIKLQAQLAMRETDPRAIHAACADIARTADHLGHVSSQLLKLARAEAAAGRGPHAAPCDFAALVRECCERAAPLRP
jgi:two-component system, OmpR family, sensor histidine kinase TctE